MIDEKVDAGGFGAAFRNQLVKMKVAHRFPLYAVKIVRDRLEKTVKITVGVAEYHELVKIHLRVVKIPDGVGRSGAGISLPDALKRRDQIHAVVKKAGEMSLQSALYVGLSQNINQAETNGIRQFVVKQRLTLEDYLGAAAAYVSVKRELLDGFRHKRIGAAAVDKKIMSVGLRLFQTLYGAVRYVARDSSRQQCAVNIKKQ